MNYRKYHGSRVAWTMSALPCKSVSSSQGLSWKHGKTTIAESGSPPWIQETQPVYKTKASVMDIDISLNEIPEEHVYVRSISGCLRSETGTCQNVCCIVWNIVYRCLLNVTSCASCAVNSGSFNFHGVIFDFLFLFLRIDHRFTRLGDRSILCYSILFGLFRRCLFSSTFFSCACFEIL